MSARADLLAAADAAATAAKDATTPKTRRENADAAKVSLEAAALADGVGGGEIEEALAALQTELDTVGLLEAIEGGDLAPVDVLRLSFRAMTAWQREAKEAAAYVQAYTDLRVLLEGLERDFTAGNSATSLRIAARIRTGLDEATQNIEIASRQEEASGSPDE